MQYDKLFISSTHQVFLNNKEAEEKLKETNDLCFCTGSDGVLSVDKERWKIAQQYEEMYWMQIGQRLDDDRNYDHFLNFDRYKILEGKEFGSVIELGCGVFTNLRLIKNIIGSVKKIVLLDPLIAKYLMHMNCTYRDFIYNFSQKGVVPDVELIQSTIEEYDPKEKFNLVVMINVLEHCFDINKGFDVIKKLLMDDGIFILAEATVCENKIKHVIENIYDAGHPIRVTDKYFENKVEGEYKILYKKVFDGLYDNEFRRDFYYILEKK